MSSSPPPGWYRDPTRPFVERWWDGGAWTEHRRGPDAPPPPDGGPGRAKAVTLVVASAVLVTAIVTGALFLGRTSYDDKAAGATGRPSSAPASSPTADLTPTPTPPPVVEDALNGISFPLLDGWVPAEESARYGAVMTTEGTYDCPGATGSCLRGQVISRTAAASSKTQKTQKTQQAPKTAEELAKADIAAAAEAGYGRRDPDGADGPYGGITAHRQVREGKVKVAGRTGYFVRWRVRTVDGPGGYVESLAFPSGADEKPDAGSKAETPPSGTGADKRSGAAPDEAPGARSAPSGTGASVVVRFAFDAGADGPPVTDMDRITRGIRPVTDEGGDGQAP